MIKSNNVPIQEAPISMNVYVLCLSGDQSKLVFVHCDQFFSQISERHESSAINNCRRKVPLSVHFLLCYLEERPGGL